jgi:hypothetical protein
MAGAPKPGANTPIAAFDTRSGDNATHIVSDLAAILELCRSGSRKASLNQALDVAVSRTNGAIAVLGMLPKNAAHLMHGAFTIFPMSFIHFAIPILRPGFILQPVRSIRAAIVMLSHRVISELKTFV